MCDIFEAARKGDIKSLKQCVNSGILIDSADSYQRTALHHAVCAGALESVQWLLWKGAEVNPISLKGWTPLHLAAVGGHNRCAEALLSRQADPNIKDGNGNIPGQLAAIHGNSITLSELLKTDMNVHTLNHMGWTMLHNAAFHGRLGCLRLLLQAGLSAEEQAEDGNNSLHLAAKEGHLPAVQCLLNSSDNWLSLLEARNDMGATALDLASELGKRTVVAYLEQVKWGRCLPAPSDCMKLDYTTHPGHVAVVQGHLPMLKRLLDEGTIKVNELDAQNATLLHKAAEHGQTECLVWLLDSGANICLRDNKSQTAIDVARRHNQINALRILQKQAIDEGLMGTRAGEVAPATPVEPGRECDGEDLTDDDLLPIDFPFGDTEAVGLSVSAERKHAARDLALRRIDLLLQYLELAKLDFRQLGGSPVQLAKRNIPTEERGELKVAALDNQLEYERLRREKLELALDEARKEALMYKSEMKGSSFALNSPLCSTKREEHVARLEKMSMLAQKCKARRY
uniref:Uncharacterized protein n=1 Tax=Schistocephalus solidus TaxID=70667 RepID=A0A0V0J271_SCHSO